jgi:hypothetical protein
MVWFFEGTGVQLNLRVSEAGNLGAYGTCFQSCQPAGGPTGIYRYVNGIEGSWSLHSPDAAEREYDGVGRALKDRVPRHYCIAQARHGKSKNQIRDDARFPWTESEFGSARQPDCCGICEPQHHAETRLPFAGS